MVPSPLCFPLGCQWQVKYYFPSPPPQGVHVLLPQICEYGTLSGKGGFADMMKALEMGRLAWIMQVGPS